MRLRRARVEGTNDVRITTPQGEDFGRAENGTILYPEEEALKVVQAINARERIDQEMEEMRRELASYKPNAELERINLAGITRHPDLVFTHITFARHEMLGKLKPDENSRKHGFKPWLEFGQCSIVNENNNCFIGGRMRDGITDFEHDSCYVVRIDLIGLQYKYTHNHVSTFDAWLTTNPKEIRIHSSDFRPENLEGPDGPYQCEECSPRHLILPEGYYVPPMYEQARIVAGQQVVITTGPRWSKLLPDDEED